MCVVALKLELLEYIIYSQFSMFSYSNSATVIFFGEKANLSLSGCVILCFSFCV